MRALKKLFHINFMHSPHVQHDRVCSSDPPEALPTDRRPLTPSSSHSKRSEEQVQSPLFHNLSLEIRLRIYEEVLAPPGDQLLHVASTHKRLCSFRCRETRPTLMSWQHGRDCWYATTTGDGTTEGRREHHGPHPETLSGLLCSCRKIYSEAIDILYTKNVINVRQTRTISEFPKVMVPHRLGSIRYLHLSMEIPSLWPRGPSDPSPAHNLLCLEDACLVVETRMAGLRSLRVSMGVSNMWRGHDITDDTLARLLGYLMQIRHVPEFLVELHWKHDLDVVLEKLGTSTEDLPFRLEEREMNGRSPPTFLKAPPYPSADGSITPF